MDGADMSALWLVPVLSAAICICTSMWVGSSHSASCSACMHSAFVPVCLCVACSVPLKSCGLCCLAYPVQLWHHTMVALLGCELGFRLWCIPVPVKQTFALHLYFGITSTLWQHTDRAVFRCSGLGLRCWLVVWSRLNNESCRNQAPARAPRMDVRCLSDSGRFGRAAHTQSRDVQTYIA
jgi:hypothetical protein